MNKAIYASLPPDEGDPATSHRHATSAEDVSTGLHLVDQDEVGAQLRQLSVISRDEKLRNSTMVLEAARDQLVCCEVEE